MLFVEDVKSLIAEFSNPPRNKEEIKDNSFLVEELGYDSISFIQLIVSIEDRLNIKFVDDEFVFENFATLNKIIDQILRISLSTKGEGET